MIDFLAHLETESHRFLDILTPLSPDTAVPSCPEWDAADLLWHLGEVQWFWGTIVIDQLESSDQVEHPERPDTYAELLDFFAEQTVRLQQALRNIPPLTEVYMWAPVKTVAYVTRRQAHEAAIHRLDAQLSAGQAAGELELEEELATDGVDEALTVMFAGAPSWGVFTADGQDPVRIYATDTDTTWWLETGRFVGTDPSSGTHYDDPDIAVANTTYQGSLTTALDPSAAWAATISGTACELDAWLWHRTQLRGSGRFGSTTEIRAGLPASAVQTEGDEAALARVMEVLAQPLN